MCYKKDLEKYVFSVLLQTEHKLLKAAFYGASSIKILKGSRRDLNSLYSKN